MNNRELNKKLSVKDLSALNKELEDLGSANAMSIPMLDGFFTALHCLPALLPPSRYLHDIFGVTADELEFKTEEQANRVIEMLMRHFNYISATFRNKGFIKPLISNSSGKMAGGNDWAIGFIKGMEKDKSTIIEILNDEENNGVIVPIFGLAYEHSDDPELRSFDKPITNDHRNKLIEGMMESVAFIYNYFREDRADSADLMASSIKQSRIGRNSECYCGSGKKYKHCCGSEVPVKRTIH